MNTEITRRDETPTTRQSKLLRAYAPKLQAAATKHLTAERLIQAVIAQSTRTPELLECTDPSIIGCCVLASELGLSPGGPLGHFDLIPRRNKNLNGAFEANPSIGYKGLVVLALRSGNIARINADVVYRDEVESGIFKAKREPPMLTHGWSLETGRRRDEDLVAAYCVVETRDGMKAQVVIPRYDIDDRRSKSRGNTSPYSPWVTSFSRMARKSAIRALLNGGLVPLTAELAKALEQDADSGDDAHQPQPTIDVVPTGREVFERASGQRTEDPTPQPEPRPAMAEPEPRRYEVGRREPEPQQERAPQPEQQASPVDPDGYRQNKPWSKVSDGVNQNGPYFASRSRDGKNWRLSLEEDDGRTVVWTREKLGQCKEVARRREAGEHIPADGVSNGNGEQRAAGVACEDCGKPTTDPSGICEACRADNEPEQGDMPGLV